MTTKYFVPELIVDEVDPGCWSWQIRENKGELFNTLEEAEQHLNAQKLLVIYNLLKEGAPYSTLPKYNQILSVDYYKSVLRSQNLNSKDLIHSTLFDMFFKFFVEIEIKKVEI